MTMNDDALLLDNFDGTARLFPLPNLVLFPWVVQPLHIFEPRYRQMLADALAGDRLLAIVLLKPGWEDDYHQQPPIHSVACLGKVFKEQKLPDGRYNLYLHGLRRIRILEEIPSAKLYRSARAELLTDRMGLPPAEEAELLKQVGEVVPTWLTAHGSSSQQIDNMLKSGLSLATLTDIFSFALPLETALKQQLLEEVQVEQRAAVLLETLRSQIAATKVSRSFPPSFSEN
jgi:Lon protease-like protein